MKRTAAAVLLLLTFCSKPEGATSTTPRSPSGLAKATFAGGCFWCMEPPFERLPGVASVISGYAGGPKASPTYEEVSSGFTGHAESVEVLYDPKKISYQQLLDVYWHNIDPLTANAQFCDHGEQYRTAIFTHDAEQQRLALASKAAVQAQLKQLVVTEIVPAATFWPAEEYHQDYYKKNPVRYKFYRYNCGRDARLEQLWGSAPAH
ncbi:MAG TPA: peptide-methionine (S)-S-oxide reductase MsrA [Thermoanaerobaculia bacterium]|nr:peptide-methionine (S)-S-oxide reductase MsrA [Thermoanaerobaculia bacterium]